MNDVLFVTPNHSCTVNHEPTGTLILATLLDTAGIRVRLLPMGRFFKDDTPFSDAVSAAISEILTIRPKILSLYTRCDTYHIDLVIAQRIKAEAPDTVIVFGGPQADLCAADTLNEFDCVDYICRGEGETTVVPFFSSLLRGEPDLGIAGLAYKKDGRIVCNERPRMLTDFSSLPPINYQLALDAGDVPDTKGFPVDVGRGCPFSCTYCSTQQFWGRHYRLKTPEDIAAEMQRLHDLFGTDDFGFEHDMFTMNRAKVIAICEQIKRLPFKAKWYCSARLDCLDRELIDIMADAGMYLLFVGIETGSERMQKLTKKNLKLTAATEILSYLGEKKIDVMASLIYGFPEETGEDLSASLELWRKIFPLAHITTQWHLLSFFPGTELEIRYRPQLTMAKKFSNMTGDFGVNECYDLITAHPSIFPQYREYKTELRENVDILPGFLYTFRLLYPLFNDLYQKFFAGDMYRMYLEWMRIVKSVPPIDDFNERRMHYLRTSETFLHRYYDFETDTLVADILRYLIARYSGAKEAAGEVYSFIIEDLNGNKPLGEFQKGFSVINYYKNAQGKYVRSVQSVVTV